MQIYLDTSHLINIFDREPCQRFQQLSRYLRNGNHQIVLSLFNIGEICAPLAKRNKNSRVMLQLRRIESVPHIYIHLANILGSELMEAVRAFSDRSQCNTIDPYVCHLAETLIELPIDALSHFSTLTLPNFIRDIYVTRILLSICTASPPFHNIIGLDRNLECSPSLKNHYATTLGKDLDFYGLQFDLAHIDDLAGWLWENPTFCPSHRIGYHLYHSLRQDKGTQVVDSDFCDLVHLSALPYVDLMGTDKRMRNYVHQVDQTLGTEYSRRIFTDLDEILGT